jgi:hypothetical protein
VQKSEGIMDKEAIRNGGTAWAAGIEKQEIRFWIRAACRFDGGQIATELNAPSSSGSSVGRLYAEIKGILARNLDLCQYSPYLSAIRDRHPHPDRAKFPKSPCRGCAAVH